jgi:hypothetical protein
MNHKKVTRKIDTEEWREIDGYSGDYQISRAQSLKDMRLR